MDCSPLGASVHGILQARILDWVTISFSGVSSRPRDRTRVSFTAGRFFIFWATREAPSIWSKLMQNWNLVFYLLRGQIFVFFLKKIGLHLIVVVVESRTPIWLFSIPWIVCSLPGSPVMGFSRQEYWRGCLFLPQRIFPNQGLNLRLLHWQLNSEPPGFLKNFFLTCKSFA